METITGLVGSASFASPLLFLVILPFLIFMAWQIRTRGRGGAIWATDLEYLRSKRKLTGVSRKILRIGLLGTIVFFIGVLWAEPTVRTAHPILFGGSYALHKTILVVIDVSGSMTGSHKTATATEMFVPYEVARKEFVKFADNFRGERIGLVLFSDKAFVARWPTTETEHQFSEILNEDISQSSSQLRLFSQGTETKKGLDLARQVLNEQKLSKGSVVVLITDLQDIESQIIEGIKGLREDGVRVYTFAVGADKLRVDTLENEFKDDDGVRFFKADSSEEIAQAYQLVSRAENSPEFKAENASFETNLRWATAFILFIVSVVVFILLSTSLHRSFVGRD